MRNRVVSRLIRTLYISPGIPFGFLISWLSNQNTFRREEEMKRFLHYRVLVSLSLKRVYFSSLLGVFIVEKLINPIDENKSVLTANNPAPGPGCHAPKGCHGCAQCCGYLDHT